TSPQRIRLLLDKHGNITSEHAPFQPTDNPFRVRLADKPINSNDVFLFHKTTHRKIFDDARERFSDYDDILLFNERGELTEFTIGNLVVEMDGKLLTPPIACG